MKNNEYKIKQGDTAWNLAKDYGISMEQLQKANPDLDLSRLQIGQKINIPTYITGDTFWDKIRNTVEVVLPAFNHALRNLPQTPPPEDLTWFTPHHRYVPYHGYTPSSDKVIKMPKNTHAAIKDATQFLLQDKLRELGFKNLEEYWKARPNDTELVLGFANRPEGKYDDPNNSEKKIYLPELRTEPKYRSIREKQLNLQGKNTKLDFQFPQRFRVGKFDAVISRDGNVRITDDYDFSLTSADKPGFWRKAIQGIMGPNKSFTQVASFPVSDIE